MSFRGFILAATDTVGAQIPRIVERALAAGYASGQGALLLLNGSGQFAECGADPALIAAVANGPGGTDTSGFNILGKKEFPPGYMQGISVASGVKFLSPYMGTLPGADGGTYGVTKDSDGFWKVDFSKTAGSARCTLLGRETNAPENQPYVIVSFLAANVQPI